MGFRSLSLRLAWLPLLAGCAAPPPPPYACLLPQEQRMLVAELFFGRGTTGRAPQSDAEWAGFAAQVVAPAFPDGFTVFDGEGRWRNPTTGQVIDERTKVLLVATPRTPDLAPRLSAVIEAYKERFGQESVGVVTRNSCAAF